MILEQFKCDGGLKERAGTFLRIVSLKSALGLVAVTVLLAGCANTDKLPYTKGFSLPEGSHDNTLSITFLGNTTIYLNDLTTGEAIFIDAFVSRPKYKLVSIDHSDCRRVDRVLLAAEIESVDWVIPLHSHFDHVLDAPYVAKKKGAKLIATPTTQHIAESMGYSNNIESLSGEPSKVERIGAGEFSIQMEPVVHGDTKIGGYLYAPLNRGYDQSVGDKFAESNWAREYVEGQSYNVYITHRPSGRSIYVLSGFPEEYIEKSQLPESLLNADIVFAAVPLFRKMGSKKREAFWEALAQNPKTIVPIHWDNFDVQLDKNLCLDEGQLTNCLEPFFLLQCAMVDMEKELRGRENIDLQWLTAFGVISM